MAPIKITPITPQEEEKQEEATSADDNDNFQSATTPKLTGTGRKNGNLQRAKETTSTSNAAGSKASLHKELSDISMTARTKASTDPLAAKDLSHVLHVLGIKKDVVFELMTTHNINSVSDLLDKSADELFFLTEGGDRGTFQTIATIATCHTVLTRDDIEQIDILKKWLKWRMNHGDSHIEWTVDFTRESIDEFRYEYMLSQELDQVFKELGISREVQAYLKVQGVTTVPRLVNKTRQEYETLIRQQQKSDEPLSHIGHRFTISDVKAIEHFKSWYTYEFIGRSLPLNWTESYDHFSKYPPAQSERDLRHVFQVLGVGTDGVEYLARKRAVRTIPMLVDEATDWLKELDFDDADKWDNDALPHNDAKQIIKFMRWYNFYVKGNPTSLNWTSDFNRVHFDEFDQYHLQPRQDMGFIAQRLFHKGPEGGHHKLGGRNQLKVAKQEKRFKEHLDDIAAKGTITPAQRYKLQEHYKKKGMIDMIQGVKANMENGNEDVELDRNLAKFLKDDADNEENRAGEELMDNKQFFKYLFGAVLVIVLLTLWFYTTIHFMTKTLELNCHHSDISNDDREKCTDFFDGYATFVHNIVFGLVTAVVVQQLGDSSDNKSSLYSRFLPIYQRQVKKVNEMGYEHGVLSWNIFNLVYLQCQRIAMGIVLMSTRLYVISWIGLGAASLIFGFVMDLNPANPIFTTGQTWLGMSVTAGYTFFGVNEQHGSSNQGGDDGNGRGDSNSREVDETTV